TPDAYCVLCLDTQGMAECGPYIRADKTHVAFQLARTVIKQASAIVGNALVQGRQGFSGRGLQVFLARLRYRQRSCEQVIRAGDWSRIPGTGRWRQNVSLDILEWI